ncbi:MAG: exodeoxyribonuclease VII large subunit [Nitrospira sp.]|nr:exodeoxyribonuclease VII large subunit [Nitrospira sp.]MCP9463963.1 exodeoxyribonuclease VII large subunit [Nitrospira sp.]
MISEKEENPTDASSLFVSPLAGSSRRILTVSELNALVRACLENEVADVWLEGEISNLRAPGSGHLYCTLKDPTGQIRAVIFRSTALRLGFALEDGLHVIGRGRVTIYEPRGEYQIVLEQVEPKGWGAQQLALEQLKKRLASEGLFDPDRKKSLPAFPRTVGIVTSPTGAAVRDILTVLHRRCPIIRIILAPVLVQGEGAAQQIVSALDSLNELGIVDVIIVGRGGGSVEDLQPFNDERVVRAIAASSVPVVSAVGHEIDVTLADFAADLRAPTPSAAAEAVAPVLREVVDRLAGWVARCRQYLVRRCESERRRLCAAQAELGNVRFRVLETMQRVDGAVIRMRQAMHDALRLQKERLHALQHEAAVKSPGPRIRHAVASVSQSALRLKQAMRLYLEQRTGAAHSSLARLYALSPMAVLSRGYSLIETVPERSVVHDVRQVTVGQDLVARLARGAFRCRVSQILTESRCTEQGDSLYNKPSIYEGDEQWPR